MDDHRDRCHLVYLTRSQFALCVPCSGESPASGWPFAESLAYSTGLSWVLFTLAGLSPCLALWRCPLKRRTFFLSAMLQPSSPSPLSAHPRNLLRLSVNVEAHRLADSSEGGAQKHAAPHGKFGSSETKLRLFVVWARVAQDILQESVLTPCGSGWYSGHLA